MRLQGARSFCFIIFNIGFQCQGKNTSQRATGASSTIVKFQAEKGKKRGRKSKMYTCHFIPFRELIKVLLIFKSLISLADPRAAWEVGECNLLVGYTVIHNNLKFL
jgi:hypothetical protein